MHCITYCTKRDMSNTDLQPSTILTLQMLLQNHCPHHINMLMTLRNCRSQWINTLKEQDVDYDFIIPLLTILGNKKVQWNSLLVAMSEKNFCFIYLRGLVLPHFKICLNQIFFFERFAWFLIYSEILYL